MNTRQIDASQPGETLWDDQVKGLHLRAYDNRKAFLLFYRTKSGQQRRPKLGDYGVLTLSAARDIARDKLATVARGGDPDAPSQKYTVEDLKKRFMDEHAPKRKSKTQEQYRNCWEHALGKLKNVPVIEVNRAHIADLHHLMSATPIQANRTVAVLKKAFNLAEVWGWRPSHTNPVFGIGMNKEKKRRRYPTEEEARRLMKALDKFRHPTFTGFIWLLMLTGCRPSEIRLALREWVKPEGLVLPESKTGARVIALSKAARQVIAKLPVVKDNPYLIPGHKNGSPLVGTKNLWRALMKDAKIEGLQMRDLRRYYASLGLSAGLTLEAVGQLLGHSQTQTTRVYAYLLNDATTRATEATAAALIRVRRKVRRHR